PPLFLSPLPPTPISTLFPYTTLFRSRHYLSRRRRHESHPEHLQGQPAHQLHSRSAISAIRLFRARDSSFAGRDQPRFLAGEPQRSEEHTSELQSLRHLVCRLLLEKKK